MRKTRRCCVCGKSWETQLSIVHERSGVCYFYRTVIYVYHVYLINGSSRVLCVAMFDFDNYGRCVALLRVHSLICKHSNDCLRLGTHH